MSKTNVLERKPAIHTHEGAPAVHVNAEAQLRRSVMACLLWEQTFYEDGVEIADRIKTLIPQVPASRVAELAIEAREKMKLRHVPLLIVREMCRHEGHKKLAAATLERVIQRVDELAEFVSLYWKDGKESLSYQAKKGLARAFLKFNEYQFAKYDRQGAVKLRDVLFLCHAKPVGEQQTALFKKIVDGTLTTPDTWEVALSGGADKKATFERMIKENTLGGLALLRNLRNMAEAKVDPVIVQGALSTMKTERILPFRFIAAARAVPQWESTLEPPMLKCLEGRTKLSGKTAIVVDNSGSMHGAKVSAKSDMDRSDAACALAILVREIAEDCVVIGFGSDAKVIPDRRGFALADAIKAGPGGGTYTQTALELANKQGYDRIIIITDEQSHQALGSPNGKGYVINVATNRNGIGYGPWCHVDGWSESVLDFITEYENVGLV